MTFPSFFFDMGYPTNLFRDTRDLNKPKNKNVKNQTARKPEPPETGPGFTDLHSMKSAH